MADPTGAFQLDDPWDETMDEAERLKAEKEHAEATAAEAKEDEWRHREDAKRTAKQIRHNMEVPFHEIQESNGPV